MEIFFSINDGSGKKELSPKDISDYAKLYGLHHIIKGRYSSLFVVNLMTLEYAQGLDPHPIIEEIKSLEGLNSYSQTKPATQFKGRHLNGLWHKHFLPALPSSFAHNISNHFGKNGVRNLVEEVFDPKKSELVTQDIINELSHRLVTEAIENRASENKLTGEWIIFAKENGKNYYLCISPHNSGDERIASNIKVACQPAFKFLSKYVS